MNEPTSHVDDLLGAFILDAVDPAERELVEAHLLECDQCHTEVISLREAATHLSRGLEVQPPARLRASVLAAVSQQPAQEALQDHARAETLAPRSRSATGSKAVWGLATAGLLAVGGWGIWQVVDEDLSPVQEVIQASDAQRFEAAYEGETVTVVTSDSLDRAALITDGLPDLGEGEVYQAWWVSNAGEITSAGLLPTDSGPEDLEATLQGDPSDRVAVALSVEPDGGSQQPTTDPILSVALTG